MSAAVVSMHGLTKRYGSTVALDDVSLTVSGGVVALLGPNGAGKTTLLRCLATVLRPDAGSVHVDGLDPRVDEERTEIRRRLGYLPQDVDFAGGARVFDVVDYFGIIKELRDPRQRHADAYRVLREVGLHRHARQKVRTLSGGMKQRLGLSVAFLGRPGLVVLDEPANGLDPEQRLILRDRLSRLGEQATVVVSTHLTDEAAAFSQVLHVLDGGRVVYSGTPASLTSTAQGRVWLTDVAPEPAAHGVRLSWRTPAGRYRCIGEPPPGAELDEPTLEDGYLLLVGRPHRAAGEAPGRWLA